MAIVGKEETVEGLLSDLVKLDYDAIEAYEAAYNRLENQTYKNCFSSRCLCRRS